MEARATLRGSKLSRTLVAGVLVVVALGVGALGGYVAANLGGGKVASTRHTAVITKSIPDQSKAVVPGWLAQEITPKTAPRILQDDIIRNAAPATAQAATTCPAGSHVAVWYTLKTTSCVSNIGHSAKADE